MVPLMADQELAGAVKRALVSNPKRDRISTAVRAENSFPTQIGTGQKAKERLSGDEPMRRGLHHQRLSLNPDLNTINTKICRQCGADRRATSARSSWRRQAARRGSYGAARRLAGWQRFGRSAVAGWDASADNPCRVRDAFGHGGSSSRKMKGRGANGVR
jgi:hypothetical protein